jgi:hypothetical protein
MLPVMENLAQLLTTTPEETSSADKKIDDRAYMTCCGTPFCSWSTGSYMDIETVTKNEVLRMLT